MKIKVLKNFSCNGVRKRVGQFLSEEECEIIGDDFGSEFVKNDFLLILEESDESDSDDNKDNDFDDNSSDDSGDDSNDDSNDDTDSDDDSNDEDENPVILEELDKPGLFEYAKKLELDPHHNTGEERLREMIREKLEA